MPRDVKLRASVQSCDRQSADESTTASFQMWKAQQDEVKDLKREIAFLNEANKRLKMDLHEVVVENDHMHEAFGLQESRRKAREERQDEIKELIHQDLEYIEQLGALHVEKVGEEPEDNVLLRLA